MNIRNEKGITLVTLIITIVLMIIISGMMGYYSTSGLKLQKINNMYSDIEQIQTKIDEYYIKNNNIPILEDVIVTFNNESTTKINPNDAENEFYVINLSVLGDLSLNYGRDFETIKNTKNIQENAKDVYIINKQSQTIYYLKGQEFEGKIYYTKSLEYKEITE